MKLGIDWGYAMSSEGGVVMREVTLQTLHLKLISFAPAMVLPKATTAVR